MKHANVIVEKVLDVPLHRSNRDLLIGSYTISNGETVTEHAVIYTRDAFSNPGPLTLRINSACFTSDIFGCNRCDCNWQLECALDMIAKSGGAVMYHFNHDGRGHGVTRKLQSYKVMDCSGLSTKSAFEALGLVADVRKYTSAMTILKDLGVTEVRLITNNPMKKQALLDAGIEVVGTIPLVSIDPLLQSYLKSKRVEFGHNI